MAFTDQRTPQRVAARRGQQAPGLMVRKLGRPPVEAALDAELCVVEGMGQARHHLLYVRAQATRRKTASVPRETRSARVTKSVRSAMTAAQPPD